MNNPFIPFVIDFSETKDDLVCQKCGNYSFELDKDGLCQICFYIEDEMKNLKLQLNQKEMVSELYSE